MLTLISYDISDNRNRTKTHRLLKEYGLNTQRSVFECEISPETQESLVGHLSTLLDEEKDSLRVYAICESCVRKVVTQGQGIKLFPRFFEVL